MYQSKQKNHLLKVKLKLFKILYFSKFNALIIRKFCFNILSLK
jgi:hypothetical protein